MVYGLSIQHTQRWFFVCLVYWKTVIDEHAGQKSMRQKSWEGWTGDTFTYNVINIPANPRRDFQVVLTFGNRFGATSICICHFKTLPSDDHTTYRTSLFSTSFLSLTYTRSQTTQFLRTRWHKHLKVINSKSISVQFTFDRTHNIQSSYCFDPKCNAAVPVSPNTLKAAVELSAFATRIGYVALSV
jgi:hypothetical protein